MTAVTVQGPGKWSAMPSLAHPRGGLGVDLATLAGDSGFFAVGGWEAGADIKYLLTSNITLDATINPDFGQVDLDPADGRIACSLDDGEVQGVHRR